MGRSSRITGRRRLPSAVDIARRPEHDDRRQRSGRHHYPECARGRPARCLVELVAQSADGADLSPISGLSLSILGDWRAAGFWSDRRSLARQVLPDLDARLGADRAGRRERLHRRGSVESRCRLRWGRPALESRRQHPNREHDEPKSARARARRLDSTSGVFQGRFARTLLRESVSVQDHRRREDLDADQPRSHAS